MGFIHTLDQEPNISIETRRESFILRARADFANHLISYGSGGVEISYELLARLNASMEHTASLRDEMLPQVRQIMMQVKSEYEQLKKDQEIVKVVAVTGLKIHVIEENESPSAFACRLLRDHSLTPHGTVRLRLMTERERQSHPDTWTPTENPDEVSTYCRSGNDVWQMPPTKIVIQDGQPYLIASTTPQMF